MTAAAVPEPQATIPEPHLEVTAIRVKGERRSCPECRAEMALVRYGLSAGKRHVGNHLIWLCPECDR